MLNDQQILDQLKAMPEPIKAEVLHYMDYLLNKHKQQVSQKKRPQFGYAKGDYKTSDDFDEPLEDFQDYMIGPGNGYQ